jgi:voltage-gated potassium channel
MLPMTTRRPAGGGTSRAAREADDGRHVLLPARTGRSPLRQVALRLCAAVLLLVGTALIVYADRSGYHDNAGGGVDLLDAFYYATVTLSTTGYGDIVPYSDAARLVNILVVTPVRVLFLIILVGTTLEVLAERTRTQLRVRRWRSRMHDHTVVIGYGTKGRNAVRTLLRQSAEAGAEPRDETAEAAAEPGAEPGAEPEERANLDQIVVVDSQRHVIEAANNDGLAGVLGDATRSETLLRAGIRRAARVMVTTQRDDTAVLATLTARELNPRATIVVAVREDENVPLLRQSGADVVVTSSSSAGRLLGMSLASPYVGELLEDLLTFGSGLDIAERAVRPEEAGRSPRDSPDLIAAVVRDGRLLPFDAPATEVLRADDRVIAIGGRGDVGETKQTGEEGEGRSGGGM